MASQEGGAEGTFAGIGSIGGDENASVNSIDQSNKINPDHSSTLPMKARYQTP